MIMQMLRNDLEVMCLLIQTSDGEIRSLHLRSADIF